MSCLPGRVVWASDKRRSTGGYSLYGNHIIVEHANGWITWYAHLSEMWVSVGDVVTRGTAIGAAGSTGNSSGPHLHLTVQHVGYGQSGYVVPDVVDPLPLLSY